MYQILVKPKAVKQFNALSLKDQERVASALQGLREHPFEGKKLQGDHKGQYSLRVWPFRIVYTIEKKIVTATVLAIKHRKDAYKKA